MKKFFRTQEKIWENNPIAKLLIYAPASVISMIITIPLSIINLPFLIFNLKIQKFCLKISLYIQHTISLSFWYLIAEYIFPEILKFPFWLEYPIILIFVYVSFRKTIKSLVNEGLEKAFN